MNQPQKIDKGFCLSYSKLSYRRKFIRTLWFGLLFIIYFFTRMHPSKIIHSPLSWLVGVVILIWLGQATYTYKKWKSEK